jgi:hypothetical protein
MSDTLHDTTGAGMGNPAGDHAADAGAIIDHIERPRRFEGEYHKGGTLPVMDLPGFGEPRETCGDEMYRFCACCGESIEIGQTCYESTCSRCAREWCRRRSARLCAKLSATWAYQYAALDDHPYYHHLVMDIPDDWVLDTTQPFDRTLEVVKQVMDEMGVIGVPIYHPYRGEEEESDDLGEWKERVFNDRSFDDVKGELTFDPHFHIVGISPHVDVSVTPEIQEETGWIIHRIQQDNGVSIGNDFDLARVVSYCLSHAGVYVDGNGDHQAAYRPQVLHRGPGGAVTPQESTIEEMDQIVRSVAPQTLGVPYRSVACGREVPRGEGRNMSVSLSQAAADAEEGDGSDGSDEGDEQEPGDGPEMEPCEGRLLDISKAPEYLQDDDWRQSAPLAQELERQYREWKRRRGIA